jgi:hypothetical protein
MSIAQVGGNHYAADYQHWDWAEEIQLGAMEYAATKYITRWRRKDGLQDLKKARSYVQKLLELHLTKGRKSRDTYVRGALDKFCTQNDVTGRERDVCLQLSCWYGETDLRRVINTITDIILDNFPEEGQAKMYSADPYTLVMPGPQVVADDPNEGDEDEHTAQ